MSTSSDNPEGSRLERTPSHMGVQTLVSVVVPTFRRPKGVLRAVESVLKQTYQNFEILVVVDGPQAATLAALAKVEDPRLHILELPENVGVAHSRNIGVSGAAGQWIAFLDDDDEWLPRKLEAQVELAIRTGGERILLSCYYFDRGASFERVMPLRKLKPNEPISEFIYCRKGFLSRSGMTQTSTYFVSRRLAHEVPFRAIRPQEDLDWLMRAASKSDRSFQLVQEPLSIYHNEEKAGREGAVGAFDVFWKYAHENRELFTPKAFSFYLATWCAPHVKFSARPFQRWWQVFRGMSSGSMTLRTFAFAVFYALLPFETRRSIRLLISSLRPQQKEAVSRS
jgi:glycosyltransferase involved in cell wall biosynthesis